MKQYRIGVELYTLRNELQQDFKGVCRDLAKLGIDLVEPAFCYGGMEPAEIAAFFKELKWNVLSVYAVSLEDIADGNSAVAQYASAFNAPYMTIGQNGDFSTQWKELADALVPAVNAHATHGRKTLYHNHNHEFVRTAEGDCAFDKFIDAGFAAPALELEPDIGWIARAGYDPVEFIKRYGQHIPIIHLRDNTKSGSTFAALGQGTLDLPACIAALENTLCDALIYEQDSYETTAWESTVASIEYLKKLLNRG